MEIMTKTIAAALLSAALSLPLSGQEAGVRPDTLDLAPGRLVRTETVGRFGVPLTNTPLYADAVTVTDPASGRVTRRYVLLRAGDHSGEVGADEADSLAAALKVMEGEVGERPKSPSVRVSFTTAGGLRVGVAWTVTDAKTGAGLWRLFVSDVWRPARPSEFYAPGKIGKLREAVGSAAALAR